MPAPLGYKDFTTGEILTSTDVDGYLMQGIWVFATAAARDTAVTSPQEGNTCYLKDSDVIQVYSGTTWATQSASNPISANILDAKGDLIGATADNTPARLAVGTNGQVLTADSTAATGLAYTTLSSGALTFVKAQTIGSAVSSVTVTGAFSATYDNYLIQVSGGVGSTTGGTAGNLTLGSTATGYFMSGVYMLYTSATVNGFNVNNGAAWSATYVSTTGHSGFITLQNPFLSDETTFASNLVGLGSTEFQARYAGFLNNTTSYTAFTLTASAGTMTGGTIRVYGFQNS